MATTMVDAKRVDAAGIYARVSDQSARAQRLARMAVIKLDEMQCERDELYLRVDELSELLDMLLRSTTATRNAVTKLERCVSDRETP